MLDDQNADDYPYGADPEEDEHLMSTSARFTSLISHRGLNFDFKVGEVFAKAVAAWQEEVAGMTCVMVQDCSDESVSQGSFPFPFRCK